MTPSDVFLVKLINGEQIIAKITDESENTFGLDSPMSLISVPQENGKVGLAIIPFMPYLLGPTVMKTAVAVIGVAADELANQYREATGAIILPPTQIQMS